MPAAAMGSKVSEGYSNQEQDAEQTKPHDNIPSSAQVYLDPAYWDQRFSKEDHYEWFKGYSHFRHLLISCISSLDTVLELGCGSSQMCDGLLADGIADITCVDISPVAVKKMKDRLIAKGCHDVKVMVADMLDLPFDSGSFDIVIEKGAMDVLLVDTGDPWKPNVDAVNRAFTMLTGVHRVLKPEGTFISISFGQPHFRRHFFETGGLTWSMQWKTFGDGFHYFCYILKKGTRNPDLNNEIGDEQPNNIAENLYQDHLESEHYLLHSQIGDDDR